MTYTVTIYYEDHVDENYEIKFKIETKTSMGINDGILAIEYILDDGKYRCFVAKMEHVFSLDIVED